jgi:hypothetical protein
MTRNLAIAAIVAVLGGVVAAALLSPRSSTAEPPTERSPIGRYQLLIREDFGGGPKEGNFGEKPHVIGNRLVILDTTTGQCWMRNDKDNKWEDLGSPTKPK